MMQQYDTYAPGAARAEVVNAFVRGVYGWMFIGLAVTGLIAYFIQSNTFGLLGMMLNIEGNSVSPSFLFWGAIIAEFGLVLALSTSIHKLSPTTATGLFLAYSALNGLTIGVIVLFYADSAVAKAFFTAAGMFAGMSAYGLLTKKDLTSMGSFLMMGLIGLVIAMVVNIFLASPVMDFVISIIGVIVFLGLTAYDTQKLKVMGETMPDDAAVVRRGTIMGALQLYLDFINLFLFMLRIFGGGRD